MRFPTNLDRLQSDMELRILTNGYTMQGVMPSPHKVGWTYTIGLTDYWDWPTSTPATPPKRPTSRGTSNTFVTVVTDFP